MGKLVEDKSQLVKFMLIRFCVISSDKAIMPFLVWEVGMKQTPSQEKFMSCFKADGGGQRVHPGWLFLHLELKIILCQSGIFWVYILWTPQGRGDIKWRTQTNHAAHCFYSLSSDVYTNNISLQGTARQPCRGKKSFKDRLSSISVLVGAGRALCDLPWREQGMGRVRVQCIRPWFEDNSNIG